MGVMLLLVWCFCRCDAFVYGCDAFMGVRFSWVPCFQGCDAFMSLMFP